MKTIKCYVCGCGEEIYEDDDACCNCGKPVDQGKFKEEPLVEIKHVSHTEITIDTRKSGVDIRDILRPKS